MCLGVAEVRCGVETAFFWHCRGSDNSFIRETRTGIAGFKHFSEGHVHWFNRVSGIDCLANWQKGKERDKPLATAYPRLANRRVLRVQNLYTNANISSQKANVVDNIRIPN